MIEYSSVIAYIITTVIMSGLGYCLMPLHFEAEEMGNKYQGKIFGLIMGWAVATVWLSLDIITGII